MPRELILIPPKQTVFRNAEPIGQGYPRQNTYTQQQMREWAQDASEVEQITREDRNLPGGKRRMDLLLAKPAAQLSAHERRLLQAHDHLYSSRGDAIRGDLLADGRVDLEGGKHRAHYLLERGTPVPVWVSARDQAQLDRFRSLCEDTRQRELTAERAGRMAVPEAMRQRREAVERELGRVAVESHPPPPEYHPHGERAERSRDRGVFRPERDF